MNKSNIILISGIVLCIATVIAYRIGKKSTPTLQKADALNNMSEKDIRDLAEAKGVNQDVAKNISLIQAKVLAHYL